VRDINRGRGSVVVERAEEAMTARKQRPRKAMAPRLERASRSRIHASVNADLNVVLVHKERGLEGGYVSLGLERSDAKRLYAFLGKAIAYLEVRKPGRARV
jgi:hypothetical protein